MEALFFTEGHAKVENEGPVSVGGAMIGGKRGVGIDPLTP